MGKSMGKTDFREVFRAGRLVTDGAMGTYYREIYGGGGRFPELDNVAAPERIEAIHREYIGAGADILRTNSFASNTETLSQTWGEASREELLGKVYENVRAACRIAAGAVEKEAPPVLRPRDTSPQTYLYGLLRVATGDPEDNNGSVFFARAKEMGYRPRDLMGRYLMTICEDKRYEYYEGFLALETEG